MSEFVAPLTAAVEKLSKKDATSVLIVVFIVFAAIAFGISVAAPSPLNWIIGLTGLASFLTAGGVFMHAVFLKPERLRAEETVRMGMLLEWIARPDVDDAHRSVAANLLPVVLETKILKREALTKGTEGRDE